ncbi:hypothetical protein ABBQ32_004727 [Trebouxia sp. C0010 RCD-2024]
MSASRRAEASDTTDVAKLEERRQKIHNLIIQEKQSHDQKLAGLNAELSDIKARLTEYRQKSGQQESCDDGAQRYGEFRSAATHGHAGSNNGGTYSDEADFATPEGPSGFSGSTRLQGAEQGKHWQHHALSCQQQQQQQQQRQQEQRQQEQQQRQQEQQQQQQQQHHRKQEQQQRRSTPHHVLHVHFANWPVTNTLFLKLIPPLSCTCFYHQKTPAVRGALRASTN